MSLQTVFDNGKIVILKDGEELPKVIGPREFYTEPLDPTEWTEHPDVLAYLAGEPPTDANG